MKSFSHLRQTVVCIRSRRHSFEIEMSPRMPSITIRILSFNSEAYVT